MDVLVALSLCNSAYILGFETHYETEEFFISDLLTLIAFLIEFLLNFFTSYVDEEGNNLTNIFGQTKVYSRF